MYRSGSTKLLDTLVVWAVNTTRQCADITSTYPDFELTPRAEEVSVMQGSVDNPLNLISNVHVDVEDAVLPGKDFIPLHILCISFANIFLFNH